MGQNIQSSGRYGSIANSSGSNGNSNSRDKKGDSSTTSEYDAFQQHRRNLVELINRQKSVFQGIGLKEQVKAMEELASQVQSDNFKVLVMGEFRRGKSTFINAMLGEKVLPSLAIPTTAIITEVKWGEPRRVRLHQMP